MQNPFTHAFGATPNKYISTILVEDIIENFKYEKPSERCYILTGVRGCGKTVLMSAISRELSTEDNWVVYNLNPNINMEEQLLAKLAEHPACVKHIVKPKSFNISVATISVGIEYDKEKLFDAYTMIAKMIGTLSKKGIKVLITIDDVSANDEMKTFAHTFQQLITDMANLPVYLIMTGLYSNYRELQEKKDFRGNTFLSRALERAVAPLDESQMAVSYFNTFDITEKESIRLAKLTKGYAFAYQLLGYWYFEKYVNNREDIKDVIVEYRSELIKYCYSLLWSEMSIKDRLVVEAMVSVCDKDEIAKRQDIIKYLDTQGEPMKSTTFNTYKERLVGIGIITTSLNKSGYYKFTLPEFVNYVKLYHISEEV